MKVKILRSVFVDSNRFSFALLLYLVMSVCSGMYGLWDSLQQCVNDACQRLMLTVLI
jgi:hypothetical protein